MEAKPGLVQLIDWTGRSPKEKWGQCILYLSGTSSGHHLSAIDQVITHIIQGFEPGHRAEGTELRLAGMKMTCKLQAVFVMSVA